MIGYLCIGKGTIRTESWYLIRERSMVAEYFGSDLAITKYQSAGILPSNKCTPEKLLMSTALENLIREETSMYTHILEQNGHMFIQT